jgi:hypothetical protein
VICIREINFYSSRGKWNANDAYFNIDIEKKFRKSENCSEQLIKTDLRRNNPTKHIEHGNCDNAALGSKRIEEYS